jgi:hypothetical protein
VEQDYTVYSFEEQAYTVYILQLACPFLIYIILPKFIIMRSFVKRDQDRTPECYVAELALTSWRANYRATLIISGMSIVKYTNFVFHILSPTLPQFILHPSVFPRENQREL